MRASLRPSLAGPNGRLAPDRPAPSAVRRRKCPISARDPDRFWRRSWTSAEWTSTAGQGRRLPAPCPRTRRSGSGVLPTSVWIQICRRTPEHSSSGSWKPSRTQRASTSGMFAYPGDKLDRLRRRSYVRHTATLLEGKGCATRAVRCPAALAVLGEPSLLDVPDQVQVALEGWRRWRWRRGSGWGVLRRRRSCSFSQGDLLPPYR